MKHYKDNNLTIKDVYGEDFLDSLFVDEAGGMREAIEQIADFRNASVTDEYLEMSLTRLQEFVEQVDNAANLHGMGGLKPLLDLAVYENADGKTKRNEAVKTLALWALGVSAQNNAPVQNDLFDLGGLTSLLHTLPVCNKSREEMPNEVVGQSFCSKLVFAVSGLVRNNETIQAVADEEGLFEWLIDHGLQHTSAAIAKKSLGLLDIVLSQNSNLHFLEDLSAKQDVVASVLLAHIRGADTDTAEKAAQLVKRVVSLRPMLFSESFNADFSRAMAEAIAHCEVALGSGEMCEELSELGKLTESVLASREVSDEEL
jgi:hypothetical protein